MLLGLGTPGLAGVPWPRARRDAAPDGRGVPRGGGGLRALAHVAARCTQRLGYFDLPLRRQRADQAHGRWSSRGWGRGAPGAGGRRGRRPAATGQRSLLGAGDAARPRRSLRLERRDAFPAELEPRLRASAAPFSLHRSAAWLDWVVARELHRRAPPWALPGHRRPRASRSAYFLLKARVYSGVTQVEPRALRPRLARRLARSSSRSALSLEQLVLLALEALEEWGVDGVEVCAARGRAGAAAAARLPAGGRAARRAARRGGKRARPAARRETRGLVAAARGGRPCLLVSCCS